MSREQKVEELAQQISDFVNSGSGSEFAYLAYLLSNEHPSLQNDIFHVAFKIIQAIGSHTADGGIDPRNANAVKASNLITSAMGYTQKDNELWRRSMFNDVQKMKQKH